MLCHIPSKFTHKSVSAPLSEKEINVHLLFSLNKVTAALKQIFFFIEKQTHRLFSVLLCRRTSAAL